MNKFSLLFLVGVVICIQSSCKQQNENKEVIEADVSLDLDSTRDLNRLSYFLKHEANPTNFPRSMEPDGSVRAVTSRDWTSGFYVGSLLYAYRLLKDEAYLNHAKAWLPFLEKEKSNDKTHDMGFKIYCSFGNAYEINENGTYKKIILESATTLSTRYNEKVGCIKSWDFGGDRWEFPVIIDNMMNLELLFEASLLSGDSTFYKIAHAHANKTLKNHFREDNSSVHVVDYDPKTGKVIKKITHQGIADSSVWARGQAWGLYGFTMAYRYTQDEAFLEQAKKIAQFIFEHPNMPKNYIPYWDYDSPNIPDAPKDASAAAVIASALLELHTFTTSENYKLKAVKILETLSSEAYVLPTTSKTPFILNHSTGNMPKHDEVDVPISYADYYYLEGVYRLSKL